jgi:hypothetical protein
MDRRQNNKMRQIVKRVKNGQDVKFICSTCGELIHSIFILTGDRCEFDWDDLPDKCSSCGAKLTGRQLVIDADNVEGENIDNDNISGGNLNIGNLDAGNLDNDYIYENVHGNVCGNIHRDTYGAVSRNASDKSNIYKRYMMDLEKAVSIDYFDMRLNGLKRNNFKVPDNIDRLRIECIERNISHIESRMKQSSYEEDVYDKNKLKEILNILRQKYNEMSRKMEDNKDFDKRRR